MTTPEHPAAVEAAAAVMDRFEARVQSNAYWRDGHYVNSNGSLLADLREVRDDLLGLLADRRDLPVGDGLREAVAALDDARQWILKVDRDNTTEVARDFLVEALGKIREACALLATHPAQPLPAGDEAGVAARVAQAWDEGQKVGSEYERAKWYWQGGNLSAMSVMGWPASRPVRPDNPYRAALATGTGTQGGGGL